MEEQILKILEKDGKALSVHDLESLLGLSTVDDLKELLKNLNSLEENYKIYRTKKDHYMLFNNSNLQIGVMIANKKGFGFVDIPGDNDVYVAASNMNGAIHGDKVVVEITSKKGIDLEGRIVKIVERKLKTFVGEVYYKDNKAHIKLDEEKVKLDIIIDKEHLNNAMEGHKVVVKVTKKIGNNVYNGEVLKILGHKNDPGVDILSICAKYDIEDKFSEDIMYELDNIPLDVSEEEMKGRKDLRDMEIFTIDGDDTKDIDDAISCKKLENGNYELGVHIADVSHYVTLGSKLNEEAFSRGTSVYLADRVIPMLPHKLSNGICSLNPNVDRLAISCVMEIDDKGNIVNYDIFESVIRSRKQMTYKKVNKILEENVVPEGYEEFEQTLKLMEIVANRLRKNKVNRGYIDFDLDEAKIVVDENGEAIDVVLRDRGKGEKLIEDFMIAANETVATHVFYMDLPFIYRVHGEPKEEKIQNFLHFVSLFGYQVKGKIKEITPKAMQDILEQLKDYKEFPIFSNLLLRSMQKAIYDRYNIGHFGIASKCYTHFTSPIRRYPDLIVHRLLRTFLFEHQINKEVINYYDVKLAEIADHSSLKERESVECEREVDDMKKAEYMMKHIGEEFTGIISSVMSFGMFVELPNLIEGLVRAEEIGDDFYEFDELNFCLVGKRHKKVYRLGDEVNVIVKAANKDLRTIDFEITKKKVLKR